MKKITIKDKSNKAFSVPVTNRICILCDHTFYYDNYWKSHGSGTNNGRVDNNCCFNCQVWVDIYMEDQRSGSGIVIKGAHYRIGSNRKNRGMGGKKITISFLNGRKVVTDNLWHQGRVPKCFRSIFKDTAEFVG